jgi:starch synthase
MKIFHATSECVPYAKTGGLADVVPSLSKALVEKGHEVYIFLPRYGIIKQERLTLIKQNIPLHFGDKETFFNLYYLKTPEGVHAMFIDYPPLFDRNGIYGIANKDFSDNGIRYLYFARAVIESCLSMNMIPDVFHAHDWQASFIPTYLRTYYSRYDQLRKAASLLTIHNLSFQGLFEHQEVWPYTYLDDHLFNMEGLEFYGKVNYLKGGIIYSTLITAVSPSYSKEIQEEEQGCGLQGLLKSRSTYLYGVLNGIDYTIWNPETDSLIPQKYSLEKPEGKKLCKHELMQQCGFDGKEELPIIGMITRLTPQKGLDLVLEAKKALNAAPLRMVILGTGMKEYEDALQEWSKERPDKIHLRIEFNDQFAHLIEAGSDIFLMPSKYEPCGLNQMYSLKYGTIPLVRHTGGLADSIVDFATDPNNGTGFKFYDYSSLGLLNAIETAISVYAHNIIWKRMVIRGMSQNFSWQKAAHTFEELYQKALEIMKNSTYQNK